MRNYVFVIFLAGWMIACSSGKNKFQVQGVLENPNGEMLVLSEIAGNDFIPVDSAIVDANGYFSLAGNTEIPRFYIMGINNRNYVHLLINPGDKVKFESNAKTLNDNYRITGSKDSELIKSLNDKINEVMNEIDSLRVIFEEHVNSPDREEIKGKLDAQYTQIVDEARAFTFSFIEENTHSLASIMALYMPLSSRQCLLDPVKDVKYFRLVDSVLSSKYPDSDAVKMLKQHLVKIESDIKIDQMYGAMLGVGDMAPDIILPSPDGNMIALSSLRGRYVLVDFWASWCAPCRQENPNLVANYIKYNRKGFEIFSVSLDKTREAWIKGIEEDGLNCIHVSDLTYWDSPVVKQFFIQSIPANFLLDKDGKIIAKNLRGENLGKELESIFK